MHIDKLGWIYIQNRKMLNVRTKNKAVFYTPGGKREGNETDEAALIREIKEELCLDLKPQTITYLETFQAQADAKPLGTMVRIACYTGDFNGVLKPDNEIEELGWFTSKDLDKLSVAGGLIVRWLYEKDFID